MRCLSRRGYLRGEELQAKVPKPGLVRAEWVQYACCGTTARSERCGARSISFLGDSLGLVTLPLYVADDTGQALAMVTSR